MDVEYYLILSAAIFCIGVYGVLARRNAVLILMSIELMLQAVNINLIAFSLYLIPRGGIEEHLGLIFAIFVITVAAAEVGLALAIILRLYRNRASVNVDEVNLMKW
ncbi:MAG: NADH-quinone oxidoreductase subunit NuoK [Dehalococcoidia bacterium]